MAGRLGREVVVSIRAPARGATQDGARHHQERRVSIRAPRTGGDSRAAAPRPSVAVSIRAPARGATRQERASQPRHRVSIRRPRTGGDDSTVPGTARSTSFQSAPPHGGRQAITLNESVEFSFQSAPPHGGRHQLQRITDRGRTVSIRAPARGATRPPPMSTPTMGFNPRPRTGGDLCVPPVCVTSETVFQSAPPHGGRRFRRAGRLGV